MDIRPPSHKETQAILRVAPPHLVRFIKLSYYLGLRPGPVELLSLTWSRVDWESGHIEVISAEKGGVSRRWVPIHGSFKAELRGWWKTDKRTGPIVHINGKPIRSIRREWKDTLQKANIKRRIRPVDLRHGFVTEILERGADIGALASVVGSSPETLRKSFQHVTNRLRKKTINYRKPID